VGGLPSGTCSVRYTSNSVLMLLFISLICGDHQDFHSRSAKGAHSLILWRRMRHASCPLGFFMMQVLKGPRSNALPVFPLTKWTLPQAAHFNDS
jgi:hypothetical protein